MVFMPHPIHFYPERDILNPNVLQYDECIVNVSVEDQNWYSSDEDESKQGGGNNYNINNMLSTLRKTSSAPR
jgi:hypothetical protein